MRGLLLAAGEGTRLRPHTSDRAKPMVPVGGTPLVDHLIGWLRRHGVTEVGINLHHMPDTVVAHLGDGSALDVSIRYSREPRLLGSAGALSRFRDFFVGDVPFVVLYGDVLTNVDLSAVVARHRAQDADLTMVVMRTGDPTRCGIVGFDQEGLITRFQEKPRVEDVFSEWANAGIYVCSPTVMADVPDPCPVPFDFARDLFPVLLARGRRMIAHPTEALVLDVGSPDRLEHASAAVAAGLVGLPALDGARC